MLQKKKPTVDVVMDILKAAQTAYPASKFIESLLFQYQERGGLSKKQLQGLYDKSSKIDSISPAKMATLEAIILKKSSKHKSPEATKLPVTNSRDQQTAELIQNILEKYPEHKRVLFYKAKFEKEKELTATEKTELEKFGKILLK